MKITVDFDNISVIVPCGNGDITLKAFGERAIQRYRKILNSEGREMGHGISIRSITDPDGALYDSDDMICDVMNDNDHVIALLSTQPNPLEPRSRDDCSDLSPRHPLFKSSSTRDFNHVDHPTERLPSDSHPSSSPALSIQSADDDQLIYSFPSYVSEIEIRDEMDTPSPKTGLYVRRNSEPSFNRGELGPPESLNPDEGCKARCTLPLNLYSDLGSCLYAGSSSTPPPTEHTSKTAVGQILKGEGIRQYNGGGRRWSTCGYLPCPPDQEHDDAMYEDIFYKKPYHPCARSYSTSTLVVDQPKFQMPHGSTTMKTVFIAESNKGPLGIHVVPLLAKPDAQLCDGLLIHRIESEGIIKWNGIALSIGDNVLAVNGTSLTNKTFDECLKVFREAIASGTMQLVCKYRPTSPIKPSNSPVKEDSPRSGQAPLPPPLPPAPPSRRLAKPIGYDPSKSQSAETINKATYKIAKLYKGPAGFGFSVCTRDNYPFTLRGSGPPVCVKKVLPGGEALREGTLRNGDILVQINGIKVLGMDQGSIVKFLRDDIPLGTYAEIGVLSNKQHPNTNSLDHSPVATTKESEELAIPPVGGVAKKARDPSVGKVLISPTRSQSLDQNQVGVRNNPKPSSMLLTFKIPFSKDDAPGLTFASLGVSVKGKTAIFAPKKDQNQSPTTNHAEKTSSSSHKNSKPALGSDRSFLHHFSSKKESKASSSLQTNSLKMGEKDLGIYVKTIIPGGAAHWDGRLKAEDQIIAINGQSLLGLSNVEAMHRLKAVMKIHNQPLNCQPPKPLSIHEMDNEMPNKERQTNSTRIKPPDQIYMDRLGQIKHIEISVLRRSGTEHKTKSPNHTTTSSEVTVGDCFNNQSLSYTSNGPVQNLNPFDGGDDTSTSNNYFTRSHSLRRSMNERHPSNNANNNNRTSTSNALMSPTMGEGQANLTSPLTNSDHRRSRSHQEDGNGKQTDTYLAYNGFKTPRPLPMVEESFNMHPSHSSPSNSCLLTEPNSSLKSSEMSLNHSPQRRQTILSLRRRTKGCNDSFRTAIDPLYRNSSQIDESIGNGESNTNNRTLSLYENVDANYSPRPVISPTKGEKESFSFINNLQAHDESQPKGKANGNVQPVHNMAAPPTGTIGNGKRSWKKKGGDKRGGGGVSLFSLKNLGSVFKKMTINNQIGGGTPANCNGAIFIRKTSITHSVASFEYQAHLKHSPYGPAVGKERELNSGSFGTDENHSRIPQSYTNESHQNPFSPPLNLVGCNGDEMLLKRSPVKPSSFANDSFEHPSSQINNFHTQPNTPNTIENGMGKVGIKQKIQKIQNLLSLHDLPSETTQAGQDINEEGKFSTISRIDYNKNMNGSLHLGDNVIASRRPINLYNSQSQDQF